MTNLVLELDETFGPELSHLVATFPSLTVEPTADGQWLIRANRSGTEFKLYEYDQKPDAPYELYSNLWHGHFETVGDAISALVGILSGYSRLCEQFHERNEKRVATWLEAPTQGRYEKYHVAMYLHPWDRGDWDLRTGERWRVVRTEYHEFDIEGQTASPLLPPLGETQVVEIWDQDDVMPESFDWFDEQLGKATPGTRWSTDNPMALAFLVPNGWRRSEDCLRAQDYTDFESLEGLVMRVERSYRDRPGGDPAEILQKDVAPHLIDFELSSSEGWVHHVWTLLFDLPSEEMRVQISLFSPEDFDSDLVPTISLLAETVGRCRYKLT